MVHWGVYVLLMYRVFHSLRERKREKGPELRDLEELFLGPGQPPVAKLVQVDPLDPVHRRRGIRQAVLFGHLRLLPPLHQGDRFAWGMGSALRVRDPVTPDTPSGAS